MERDIKRKAYDEAAKRAESTVSCRIISFRHDAPGGPKALVVPQQIWRSWEREYDTIELMLREHAIEVDVLYPHGVKFHPDKDEWDILIRGEYQYAISGELKRKPDFRPDATLVPRGWTADDMALFGREASEEMQEMLPNMVRRRATMARLGGQIWTDCGTSAQPQYPQPGDLWMGPLRFDLDQERVEFWASKNTKLMQASRAASQWATDNLRFPKTRGNTVGWRGRMENPLQDMVPSSAVTPYKRFIYTLFDPGIIVGAIQAIRTFFKELEGDTQFDFERIDRHEVVDFERDVPIY